MRWFKHFSDAYSNLKTQQVIAEHGVRGYGFFWVCCEFVAQQGDGYRVKSDKNWKKTLGFVTREDDKNISTFLEMFARINLIDKKGLEMGDLYIPKMKEYADEYTDKRRRVSRQYRDFVRLEENRIEENRIDKKRGEDGAAPPKPEGSIKYLDAIPEADMLSFTDRFDATPGKVRSKAEDLKLYCIRRGKTYKDYKAFLLNALKRDFKERQPEDVKQGKYSGL